MTAHTGSALGVTVETITTGASAAGVGFMDSSTDGVGVGAAAGAGVGADAAEACAGAGDGAGAGVAAAARSALGEAGFAGGVWLCSASSSSGDGCSGSASPHTARHI